MLYRGFDVPSLMFQPCFVEQPPYLRVARLDRYPFPRPVIIYGPLADRAQQLLLEEVCSPSTEDEEDGEVKFEVPPISGSLAQPIGAWETELFAQSSGAIRLSAIQVGF